jgi:hypothetical protein
MSTSIAIVSPPLVAEYGRVVAEGLSLAAIERLLLF